MVVSSHVGGSFVLTSTTSEGPDEPSSRPIAYHTAVAARRFPLLLNALIAAREKGKVIKSLNPVH